MSLLKCHDCGQSVSSEAKACPSCGAKVRRPTSIAAIILSALILFGIVQCSMNSATKSPPPPKTAEELAKEKAEEDRFQTTAALVALLKKSTRNPDSFQIDGVGANDDASIVCVNFRGQNGFGGISVESVVFNNGKASRSEKDWNRFCVGNSLHDMKHVRHAIR